MDYVYKGYKFGLYPTKDQATMMNKTIGSCRYVFNQALSQQNHKNIYWSITQEMVQNGQLAENHWKSEYFNAVKAQKEMTFLKRYC